MITISIVTLNLIILCLRERRKKGGYLFVGGHHSLDGIR